ncbi:type IV pilus assembly protein PilE [Thiogranum longum]|uniref:Type IV pilus assembly protein PilE n=1 Tax=Thiogranum longum TaxID=1537524 RepID=A0A4R1HI98_9GAMM|nr:type IV pilin protein [Thiogranum longum]TCK19149.1 type IV pilus assembly protein PilE [Thiogranum longum]
MHKHYGFTLIELMIVIAIVAILASIAYPSYQDQVRKSRRADCEGSLLGLANAMERFHTANNTFATATIGAGAGNIFPNQCPIDGGTATYDLTIAAASGSAYTIQAAPTGPQATDKCGTLTLTSTGLKGVTAATGGLTAADCW